jgi:hypothetical protein
MVLKLGHDIPLAGHLGNKKTRDRIMQHFFWPGIFNDISEYFLLSVIGKGPTKSKAMH